jgi:predicted nuclease with TOPRIM domain
MYQETLTEKIEKKESELEELENEIEELKSNSMSIEDFIDQHKEEIINSLISANCIDNDFLIDSSKSEIYGELETWILNDECLYNWALSENVIDL